MSGFSVWGLIRGSGLAAYGLLWLSVTAGLATGLMRGQGQALLRHLHEAATRWCVWLGLLHAGLLLYDRYVPFTWVQLLWPLAAPYRPLATALGAAALWGLLLLVLTFDLRQRLGSRVWTWIHRLTPAFYAAAAVHGIYAGTDSVTPAVQAMYRWTTLSTALLFALRLVDRPARIRAAPRERGAALAPARRRG